MIERLRQASLYWHTIKYLRLSQITGRIRFRLVKPKVDLSAAPALREAHGPWVRPARRAVSMTGPSTFVFLGETGTLEADGWDNPARPKLWRYNQHYFDDLNAIGAKTRQTWHQNVIARWISDNPPPMAGDGGSAWEPYPVSLRVVNWIKWAKSGGELTEEARHSLAVQVRWLSRRLEWHILGNHLFVNAKALIMAGSFFEGPEAEKWLKIGADILLARGRGQLNEQILADGGQFELAPMYHVLLVEDLLDMVNVLQAVSGTWGTAAQPLADELLAACNAHLPSALNWMEVMAHPDDRVSFFNDSAFGIAPELSEIRSYAGNLGLTSDVPHAGVSRLEASGYARLEGPIGRFLRRTTLRRNEA